jgi:hypothetical protein
MPREFEMGRLCADAIKLLFRRLNSILEEEAAVGNRPRPAAKPGNLTSAAVTVADPEASADSGAFGGRKRKPDSKNQFNGAAARADLVVERNPAIAG